MKMNANESYFMILASSGQILGDKLLDEHLDKPLSECKLVHITSASTDMGIVAPIEEQKKYYAEICSDYQEIDIMNYNEPTLRKILDAADVVHVDGGNTFRLLKAVRQSGLNDILKELLPKGLVYIGTSAGTILVTPSIVSCTRGDKKKEQYGITDMSAMDLVSWLIAVHYKTEQLDDIEWGAMDAGKHVWMISDEQAILVKGGEAKLVGGGDFIFM